MPRYQAIPAYALFARVELGSRKGNPVLVYVYTEEAEAIKTCHKLANDGCECWIEETTLKKRAR